MTETLHLPYGRLSPQAEKRRWTLLTSVNVCFRFAHPGYAQGRADIYILFGRTADKQVKLLRVIGMVIYFKFAANAFLIDGICIRHFHHYVLFRIFQRIMYYSRTPLETRPPTAVTLPSGNK